MFDPAEWWNRHETHKPKGVSMKIALALHRIGLTSDLLHGLGFASILGAVSLWGRSAAVSNDSARARSERLAIFIGLWPPTFFLLGKVLQDIETEPTEQARKGREAKGETLEDALSTVA
jgi:hypothetical protein